MLLLLHSKLPRKLNAKNKYFLDLYQPSQTVEFPLTYSNNYEKYNICKMCYAMF